MNEPFFSVIVVSLNAGKLIDSTIRSTLEQTDGDFEIIVKDGQSKDDTLSYVPQDSRIKVYSEPDVSLYDAMNQGIDHSTGRYLIFMNCGDVFASPDVLAKTREAIADGEYGMVYGDYSRDDIVRSQPKNLTWFYMFRTPLCHQSIVFNGDTLRAGLKYEIKYKILADYNMELYLCRRSKCLHVDTVVCVYLGGGISETKEGLAIKRNDRRGIIRSNYTPLERFGYNLRWRLTLPTLRGLISGNKGMSRFYYSVVNRINGR